ncbi:RusA family crossover junction endodeoxyribonuclease [Aerococcaceae bacterium zg-B36]|uniref:RusA family crossover junction endodeoxyribonuclease n=1 Tax=Aerococcaceae bacterium zg-252 TaxID=2796928 RepID=UPI001BD898A7|nr:RusA family crossover junction endodeoxyribonuclease [Aerococcaceae bacterium zg-B36]
MTERVLLYIPQKCIPKGRPRFNTETKAVYTPKKTQDFEKMIGLYGKNRIKTPINKPIKIEIKIRFAIPKSWTKQKREDALKGKVSVTSRTLGDLDNLSKSILDGLNGIAFTDDSNIVRLDVEKLYGEKDEIVVMIEEVV